MSTTSTLVARLIREGGCRVHELHFRRGYYVPELLVRDLGELRHVEHANRILTRRQAGEWIDLSKQCGGYVPAEAVSS